MFSCLGVYVFLQLLYILGVYWAGPDIASAFQVHTGNVIPNTGHVIPNNGHVIPNTGHVT